MISLLRAEAKLLTGLQSCLSFWNLAALLSPRVLCTHLTYMGKVSVFNWED